MRAAVVAVCIALCASVAAADKQSTHSTWMRDWLSPAGAKTQSSSYYGELEQKTVCFRQASFCHMKCDAVNPCALDTFTDTANLACTTCPEDILEEEYYRHAPYDYSDQLNGLDLTASAPQAKCFMHKVRHDTGKNVPLDGLPGVSMAGTFTGVCYLANHNTCKGMPEGCEGTEVSIQGVVYTIDSAVRVGPQFGGAPGDIPNTCQRNVPNPIREGPTFDEPTRSDAKAQLAKPAAAATAALPEAQVVVGKATIYSGPFTVHSHTHPLKFTRGYFQFSFFSNEQAPVPANTVTHLPKFGDETYQFQFLSDAAARY